MHATRLGRGPVRERIPPFLTNKLICRPSHFLLWCGVVVLVSAQPLAAQGRPAPDGDIKPYETALPRTVQIPEHGAGATKGCDVRCAGETMDCTATAIHLDDYDDVIMLKEAYDTVESGLGPVRVPPTGNLPIIRVMGNARCTDDGGTCDPATGLHCTLPCIMGAPEMTEKGLPGLPDAGAVRFAQDLYVIQPNDVPNLPDMVTFVWADLCNSAANNCPQTDHMATAGANSQVPDCDDGDECTEDVCEMGGCSSTPQCETEEDCPDPPNCHLAECTLDGCCQFIPDCETVDDCQAPPACHRVECMVDGCCEAIPDCAQDKDCLDDNECTLDQCSPQGCCGHIPECESDVECVDANPCSTGMCTPDGCCVQTQECVIDDDCDQGDPCVVYGCDANGCCNQAPRICPDDDNSCTIDDCVAGSGCIYPLIEPPPAGCNKIPTVSEWGLLILSLLLACAAKIHFRNPKTDAAV